jgi:tRNA(adenine34) deaminase
MGILENSNEYYMQEALKEARMAFEEDEIPIGAVIVCGGRIIARGHNMTEKLNDVTAHAEMLCYTSAAAFLNSKYLIDCTLYVTLEPCLMCAGASFWSQIPYIVFGAYDEKRGVGKWASTVFHPSTKVEGGVLATESASLLKIFFQNKRKS